MIRDGSDATKRSAVMRAVIAGPLFLLMVPLLAPVLLGAAVTAAVAGLCRLSGRAAGRGPV
jgi:hypothetical protein